ncbi:hypothetical protein ACFSKW_35635 [Nonomuraea mangrovi]|uniref:Integral membrane protein n=1 Tax=Nonomuraea mangrovi TaxID=2316207 RepID=A0ABW4T4F7_9ACTN
MEFLIAGGFVVTVAACAAVAVLVPVGTPRVVAMAAVAGAYAAWSRSPLAASATVLMVWCFTTGFLVNTAGELTLTRPDMLRFGVFAAAAFAGSMVARSLVTLSTAARRRPDVPRQARGHTERTVPKVGART